MRLRYALSFQPCKPASECPHRATAKSPPPIRTELAVELAVRKPPGPQGAGVRGADTPPLTYPILMNKLMAGG
jgi:hypothetical protein